MPESPERPEKHAAGGGGGGGEHMLNREHNPMVFAQIRSQTRSTKNRNLADDDGQRAKTTEDRVQYSLARGVERAAGTPGAHGK